MADERRKYPRISTNVGVRFSKEIISAKAKKYLSGVAENCSLGGMFLATDHILPIGSIVTLEFAVEHKKKISAVQARAVVRWVSSKGPSKGMGLEFIEFQGLGNRTFADWTKSLFEKEQEEEG